MKFDSGMVDPTLMGSGIPNLDGDDAAPTVDFDDE